jgi:hypothetical protein
MMTRCAATSCTCLTRPTRPTHPVGGAHAAWTVATQLVFEDPYEDEFDSDGDAAVQDGGGEDGDGAEMDELEEQLRVWRPGIDKLAEDEVC